MRRFHTCVDGCTSTRRPGPPVGLVPRPTRAWMCRLRSFDPSEQGRSCRLHACVDAPDKTKNGFEPITSSATRGTCRPPQRIDRRSTRCRTSWRSPRCHAKWMLLPVASSVAAQSFHARGCADVVPTMGRPAGVISTRRVDVPTVTAENAAVSTRLHACTWMYRRRPPHAPAGCRAATSAWMYRSLGQVGLSPVPRAWMCRHRIETRRRTTMRGL